MVCSKAGLHDALAKFLDKAGDGMMTWLMQSMSATAGAVMKHQSADEMMGQHWKLLNLLLKARNAYEKSQDYQLKQI